MSDRTWWISTRAEGCFSGPFNSREEAIAELDGPGFVGYEAPLPYAKTARGTPRLLSARHVIELVADDVVGQIGDEHPEHDTWLADVPRDDEAALEEALNRVLWDWLNDKGFPLPKVIAGVERVGP